ncbi:hypothetical protein E2320_009249 [Naja naja]|nr:hypothetical protein E2320_009249 [Naja naja]
MQSACLSCRGNHFRLACRFRNAICLNCQLKGHIARVCKAGRKMPQPQTQPPVRYQKQRDECFTVNKGIPHYILKQLIATVSQGKECPMEIDMGSSLLILSRSTLKRLIPSISKK